MRNSKKAIFKRGIWFYDHHEMSIKVTTDNFYYVDCNVVLDEEEIQDWIQHLSKKWYSKKDMDDFEWLIRTLSRLDLKSLRKSLRKAA